ncbi:MAG: 50S ribosome-binding GTPase [Acidobacteria bacterium]|nr:50S ribosome-binding GTPase [Acidobacteriota bacterium]
MRDVLRVSTAGSVDDGKSTLIGRLLYETQNVASDQLKQLEHKGELDLSRLTDGLRAEREQGITIDVAFRYLNTSERRIVLADSPGHAAYTRNMATAASDSDCAVILLDAQRGIRDQSRRHALIASTMNTAHLIVVVNKMDLVDYRQSVFQRLEDDFGRYLASLGKTDAITIPVSALKGDNVVVRGASMGWYQGPTLLEALEAIPLNRDRKTQAFRMPVQWIARSEGYRGISGTVASGHIAVGDEVLVMPSGQGARVASIATARGGAERVDADTAVTLTFDRDLDVSRGHLLVHHHLPPKLTDRLQARLVWFHSEPLQPGQHVWLKSAASGLAAIVERIDHVLDVDSLNTRAADRLELNELGLVQLKMHRAIPIERYVDNKTTGSFILIDPVDNHTLAAGMVTDLDSDLKSGLPPSVTIRGEADVTVFARVLQALLARHSKPALVLTGREHPESVDLAVRSVGVIALWTHPHPGDSTWAVVFEEMDDDQKVRVAEGRISINRHLVSPEEAALIVARHLDGGRHE